MKLLNLSPLPDLSLIDDEVGENETKLLVPGFRQLNAHACGPISVYSVVKTFNRRASYPKIYLDCNPSKDEGTGWTQIVRALRQNKIGVSIRYDLNFQDIAGAIEAGFPIIVGERRNGAGSDHWAIIYGVGRRPNRVFTCNQTNIVALSGREEFTWQDWRIIWNEYGFGLVCWGKSS